MLVLRWPVKSLYGAEDQGKRGQGKGRKGTQRRWRHINPIVWKGQTHRHKSLKHAVEEKVPHHLPLRDLRHKPYQEVGDHTKGSGKDNPVRGSNQMKELIYWGAWRKDNKSQGWAVTSFRHALSWFKVDWSSRSLQKSQPTGQETS